MGFLGWIAYVLLGLFVTVMTLLLAHNPWFVLVVALLFIFGPKVWKRF